MKILVIGNLTDKRCGFQNMTVQTVRALQRAGHYVQEFDGTYSQVYARQQIGDPTSGFLPPHAELFEVIHTIWHPATLNHYSGCQWPAGPILSVWNGCPAAWCPFTDQMHVRWGVLGTEPDHEQIFYPIPDWVKDLPWSNQEFTVGYSGVRREGVEALTEICQRRGWTTNFSAPDKWLTVEEEITRLARSTVNVGWYGAEHDDRSGSAMICLASRRPFLCNDVRMFTHVKPYAAKGEIYLGLDLPGALENQLLKIEVDAEENELRYPSKILREFSWSRACELLEGGWRKARRG